MLMFAGTIDILAASSGGNAIYYFKNTESNSGTLAQSFQSAVTISTEPFGPCSISTTETFLNSYTPAVLVASYYSYKISWCV